MRACSPMGGSTCGCAQDERQEVAAVLQWHEDPSRHALRRVQGMGRRQGCRNAGTVQLASRAGGLEIAGVGAGRRYQLGVFLMSWVVVISNKNPTKNSYSTVRNHVVSWSLFIKSGRRLRSGQSWRCRSERQCARQTFSWPTIGKPTRPGAWIGRNYSCISRQNCCKTSTPGDSGLDFRKGKFAHFSSTSLFWAFLAGYVQDTKGLGMFVLLACFHWSNPSASWTLGFVGAAKLGTPV